MNTLLRPAIRILVIGAALSAALIWAAIAHINAVASGTEITLEAQGFDPRALLTGHYTQVRYQINSAQSLPRIAVENPHGEVSVWVAIAPSDGDWAVTAVSRERPHTTSNGEHLVRAKARLAYVATDEDITNYDLRYGIERIYAQQSEAEALDKLLRGGLAANAEPRLKIVVSLGKDSRLRIKGVIAEGVRTDLTWW